MKKSTLFKTMLLLCALVVGSGSSWATDYEKITTTAGLEAGANYLLVDNSGTNALGVVSGNIGGIVSVSVSKNKITNPSSDVAILTLGGTTGAWTFTSSKNSNKYLAYTLPKGTTKNNNLFIVDKSTDNGATWTITFSDGVPTITNVYNDERAIKFNSDRFCCYASAQTAVALYKEVEETGDATTTTINASGITNTNKFLGTAAGTLTASVVVTSTSVAVGGATVTWSSSDEDVATVGSTTGVVTLVGAGTTTITASYAGSAGVYKSSSDEYELTVTNQDPNLFYEEKTSFGSGETSGTLESLITYTSYKGGASTSPAIYNSGIRLYQINSGSYGGYIKLSAPTGFSITAFSITSTSTNATTVNYTAGSLYSSGFDGSDYSLDKSSTYEISGLDCSDVYIYNLGTGSSNRLEIGSINVYFKGEATVSLNAACTDGEKYYGTYSNSYAFVVPSDLTVSCVGVSAGKLAVTNYSTGEVVKANTGVMVSSTTSGNHTITLSGQTGTEKDGNLLKPTGSGLASASDMSAIVSDCKYYRLTMHNGTEIGFWWGVFCSIATIRLMVSVRLKFSR